MVVDENLTIRESLKFLRVIEYPTFYVALPEELEVFLLLVFVPLPPCWSCWSSSTATKAR